jgi:hypothetical protein
MTDDELEIWRRQWRGQPAVPIDLIRKVERQTIYMRFGYLALFVPGSVGVGAVVLAVLMPSLPTMVLAVGVWAFLIIIALMGIKASKSLWAPTTESTAAYVDLSVRRCRAQLKSVRLYYLVAPLLTIFIMAVQYWFLASYDVLKTSRDIAWMVGAWVYASAIMAFVGLLMRRWGKKVRVELSYLENLQRRLGED